MRALGPASAGKVFPQSDSVVLGRQHTAWGAALVLSSLRAGLPEGWFASAPPWVTVRSHEG